MKKADRLNKLEMSKIRMTSKLMDQLEAEGRDIIRFTYGEPNFDTPKYIKDAAQMRFITDIQSIRITTGRFISVKQCAISTKEKTVLNFLLTR